MRKIILLIVFLSLAFIAFDFVFAQENQIEIDFFYSRTCPHCGQESKFLDNLESQPEIKINRFEVADKDSLDLLIRHYNDYNVPLESRGLIPVTFIGNNYFIGFNEKIGKEIKTCILGIIEDNSRQEECQCQECSEREASKIDIPFVGKIDIKEYSLPALAVILGVLDGFNVCSLGALILILGLVLGFKSRKKVLIFGGIFIFTTTLIYGFLIILWYQVFTFFTPYLRVMEILIGLLGIGGGIYFLKEFIKFKKYGPACEIGAGKKIISKFSSRFQKSLAESGNILLLAFFVLVFAAIITVVEFPCSAAVPVIFAGILSQAQLSTFYYLLYIIIFLVFYMLDELIVFFIAFFTMKIWLASSKSITWITLVEAIILFGLGVYYLSGFSILL